MCFESFVGEISRSINAVLSPSPPEAFVVRSLSEIAKS
jgi:hypothetical protein